MDYEPQITATLTVDRCYCTGPWQDLEPENWPQTVADREHVSGYVVNEQARCKYAPSAYTEMSLHLGLSIGELTLHLGINRGDASDRDREVIALADRLMTAIHELRHAAADRLADIAVSETLAEAVPA